MAAAPPTKQLSCNTSLSHEKVLLQPSVWLQTGLRCLDLLQHTPIQLPGHFYCIGHDEQGPVHPLPPAAGKLCELSCSPALPHVSIFSPSDDLIRHASKEACDHQPSQRSNVPSLGLTPCWQFVTLSHGIYLVNKTVLYGQQQGVTFTAGTGKHINTQRLSALAQRMNRPRLPSPER